jgi:chemotaxis protein methyltransferase CheR
MSESKSEGQPPSVLDIELRLLLEAVYQRYHYDFRNYALASLRRRVTVAQDRLGCPSISKLQDRILHEPEAFDTLLRTLTVQVSDLFRDPAFFRAFRERLVPELATYPSLRLWVAGCSTGEEAYSFAVVLREEGLLDRALIYATDINGDALAKASAGVYALDRLPAFSDNYREAGGRASLSDHYTAAYGGAVFDRSLRPHLVFSDHSLATDKVFAEVQLVSCRNVLIYFDRSLQTRATGLFEEALCRRGFLGLGARETLELSPRAQRFQEFDRVNRWYVRR